MPHLRVRVPHVIPYQGSKRKLAAAILAQITFPVKTLFEPFAGSAAITLACATNGKAGTFVLCDKLPSLAALWGMVLNEPSKLVSEYAEIWHAQKADPAAYYLQMRTQYNNEQSPAALLYLLARCVKNAVRFNGKGEFNQGADQRRLGLRPEKLAKEVAAASAILRGRTTVESGDFRQALRAATPADLVYLDPPYQGTSGKQNPRYAFLLQVDELIDELATLNRRDVPFILSFDGKCGDKSFGDGLPSALSLKRLRLAAGRSAQATLLGRNEETVESLYLSPAVLRKQRLALAAKV